MKPAYSLFEAYGIEIEYMIVDRNSCDIRPLAEVVLVDGSGAVANEVEHGDLCWSNELVQHVVELKTNGPVAQLDGCAEIFHRQVKEINRILEPHNCMLLPGATHPFMDPLHETRLWQRENSEIYQAFNAIFDCRGHGWSNLQSMHLNLPFQGDDEFFRLHSSIRAILPFIPAIAASSPFQDGRDLGVLDGRLVHYARNCARIPQVTGLVVPEPVESITDYQRTILEPLYREIAPFDHDRVLQEEWLNARGAIARFDRQTIEIRVIDSQECPAADLAVAEMICSAIKQKIMLGKDQLTAMNRLPTEILHNQLQECIKNGDLAEINDPNLRSALVLPETVKTVGNLWQHWFAESDDISAASRVCLEVVFDKGCLARRMKNNCTPADRISLAEMCRKLSGCLQQGMMYGL